MEPNPREGTISIREYARRRNCSDTSVHKAIDTGKIKNGVIRIPGVKWPRIDPDIADQEWVENFNVMKSQNENLASAIFKQTTQEPAPDPQPPRRDDTPRIQVPSPQPAREETAPAEKDFTLAQAQKARAVYEAKIKELEYKEKLGTLVDKARVYRLLFAFGQELRSSIQALPDRIIDDLLAQPNRNAAHATLYNSLSDILEAASKHPDLTKA